jgi:hypothetical protein
MLAPQATVTGLKALPQMPGSILRKARVRGRLMRMQARR